MSDTTEIVDYARLNLAANELSDNFCNAQPFPHIVIDNFLSQGFVSKLNASFPDISVKKKAGATHIPVILEDGTEAQLGKQWLSRERLVPLIYRRLYWELNNHPFVGFLEKLSGIPGLIADPHMNGGGVHSTKTGGYLKVHADFNKHPLYGLDRRLNLLIYLNEDWPAEYGGDLELWSDDMKECVHKVSPIANRCVIFRTTSTSFHGHPHPLNCPEGRTRNSIALYYYSNGRPQSEGSGEHKTLWQELPQ